MNGVPVVSDVLGGVSDHVSHLGGSIMDLSVGIVSWEWFSMAELL
jgi:hypothetical protein